jgi:polyisoprenyl-phosphate glycosyltransferase
MAPARPSLSVVIPIYNEEENLAELERAVSAALVKLRFRHSEVLLVSDGSTDRSEQMIARIVRDKPEFRGLFLTRNFGHQAAISTGLAHSRGDVVVIMDGDLQDPPQVIEDLVQALENGADVAYAVRASRKENFLKRGAYAGFYRLLRRVASIDIPLDTGDFCAMKRRVVDDILQLPERNRFVRGLRAWVGYKQVPIRYERAERLSGTPKYNLRKLMALAYDGLFSFSAVPIRAIQLLGFIISTVAIATAVGYLLLAVFTGKPTWPQGFATLVISIWFLGGVQLLFMGLVGEYVHRTYEEARGRPSALVRETIVHTQTAEAACRTNTEKHIPSSTIPTGGGEHVRAS